MYTLSETLTMMILSLITSCGGSDDFPFLLFFVKFVSPYSREHCEEDNI